MLLEAANPMIIDSAGFAGNVSLLRGCMMIPPAYRELSQVMSCGNYMFSPTHHPDLLFDNEENATRHSRSHVLRVPRARLYFRTILLLFAVALMVGCSLMRPSRKTDIGTDYNFLAGNICCNSTWPGTIVVAAYKEKQGKLDVAGYTILHEPGPYELMVPYGRYHVLAFRDENEDLIFEKNEPLGIYGHNSAQWIKANGITVCPNIVISGKSETTAACPFGLAVAQKNAVNLHTRPAGEIIDLNNDLFDGRYGAKGYWAPKDFLRKIGVNIFFLEDYDPAKIPVLFIHGATGTPRGWRCLIESMDRTRFQPWFYFYPSGAPVKSMSDLLFWKLLRLRKKYHFTGMFITAHSMGGLIARSFIMDFGERFPFVRLFLSISTPWGGDKLAEYGMQQSPVVVPCWRDLQPDGDFLKSLYSRRMPEDIDFYIFFGHKGNRNPFRSNNDGIISLASLLDLRSQSDAKMVFGFNEDHDSILSGNEVLRKYNTVLNEYKWDRL